VKGFHLLNALTAVHAEDEAGLLTRFGGHAHAVGFALASAKVTELRKRMEQYAAAHAGEEVTDELLCDGELRLSEMTPEFLAALELLGPFGQGNPEPLFVCRGVRLAAALKVVKERHLRVSVEDGMDGGKLWGGMAWSRKTDWAKLAREDGWAQGDALDLAFRLRRNWHPEFGGWELEIVAMRRAEQT
jgi:single-stranded-DNA-specific exonuclease